MVRRRASDAGIEMAIECHTFRATGITDYLKKFMDLVGRCPSFTGIPYSWGFDTHPHMRQQRIDTGSAP
jgi:hypothetical protein